MTAAPAPRRRTLVRVGAAAVVTGLLLVAAGCGVGPLPLIVTPNRAAAGPATAPSGPPVAPSPTAQHGSSTSDAATPVATRPARHSPSAVQSRSAVPTTPAAPSAPSASPSAGPTRTYPHVAAPVAPTHVHGHPVIYLTYDDGPIPGGTPLVLAALARHDAVATFFVMGYLSARYPGLLRAEAAAGMAIGSHTWSHKDLLRSPDHQVTWQLRSTSRAIRAAVGVAPTCLRPPYGAVDDRVRALAAEQGLTAWLWNNDWTGGSVKALEHWSAAKATRHVLSGLRPGSVVLLHDGETNGPLAAQITDRVLTTIAARGWRTATLCPPAEPGATSRTVGGPS